MWGEPRTDLANPVFKIDFNSLAPCGANPLYEKGADSTSAFQLTRPVWGEPANIGEQAIINRISTHSPRVGRTRVIRPQFPCGHSFQLTRPVWGEPLGCCAEKRRADHFNSLAPCGANPRTIRILNNSKLFQLTRPVWGEPRLTLQQSVVNRISTHSPRVGRTLARQYSPMQANRFQLTRPVWGEPDGCSCGHCC